MAHIQQPARSRPAGGVAAPAGPPQVAAAVPGPRRWLGRRHSLGIETAVLVALYIVYDASRGLVGGRRTAALAHAQMVASWEQGASVGIERGVQRLAGDIPGLIAAFGWGYMSLHLGATGAALLWLHRRRSEQAYVQLRTALLLASGLGLVGFVLFPTAPPRLAAPGIADTVSSAAVNLNSATLRWLYNPYAAVPSIHIAYATLVGFSLVRWGQRRSWQWLGALYPIWIGGEVIATGNHFVLDVVLGLVVAAAALGAANLVTLSPPANTDPGGRSVDLPIQRPQASVSAGEVVAVRQRRVPAAVDTVSGTEIISTDPIKRIPHTDLGGIE